MAAAKGAQLSKNVLQMKFMQRSVLRIEREQNEDERQKIIDDEHWVLDLPEYKTKEQKYVKDQSYTVCEELLFGRQSFQGFNPEIEKLMKAHQAEQESKQTEEKEKQNTVTEEDMAKRYTSLMGVIAKKFAKKRARKDVGDEEESSESSGPKKKKGFMKPAEDD